MKLDFDQHTTTLNISAYSKGGITIGGQILAEPFVVAGNDIVLDLLPSAVTQFGLEHVERLIEFGRSIILIGTGERQILFDSRILGPAYAAHVGIEVMTTAAACRSYNVLVAENRAVLGAFYMP